MGIMMSIYFNSRTFHKIILNAFERNLESLQQSREYYLILNNLDSRQRAVPAGDEEEAVGGVRGARVQHQD